MKTYVISAMNALEWLFWPMRPFVWHPGRIVTVAGIFFLSFVVLALVRRFRSWPLLIPAVAWGLYAPWEAYCQAQQYDIRIDLLLLYPILIIVTLGGVLAALRPRETRPIQSD